MDNILIPILSLDLQKAQQTEEEIATHRAKLAQYKATWRAAVGFTVTCIILPILSLDLQKAQQQSEEETAIHRAKRARSEINRRAAEVSCISNITNIPLFCHINIH